MSLFFINQFLTFVLFAFLGWIIEVIYAFYIEKRWINRGFLSGPFCPIYGVGALLIYGSVTLFGHSILADSAPNLIKLFVLIFLVTSGLEVVTGYALERLFHAKWWDYSEKKFNFRGYICLQFSILWGIVGIFVVKVLIPLSQRLFGLLDTNTTYMIAYTLMAYFVIDGYYTVRSLLDIRKLILELERISGQLKVELERIKSELELKVAAFEVKKVSFGSRKTPFESDFKTRVQEWIEDIKMGSDSVETELKDFVEKSALDLISTRSTLVNKIYEMRLFRAFPEMLPKGTPDLLKPVRDLYLKRKNGR